MSRFLCITFLTFSISFAIPSFASTAMYNYILTVLKEDLSSKASEREQKAAHLDLDKSLGAFYPQINLRGETGITNSDTERRQSQDIGLYLNQTIFDQTKVAILKVGRSTIDQQQFSTMLTKEKVIFESGTLFIKYIEALKREQISSEHTLQAKEQEKFVRDRIAGGQATQIDLKNVEIATKRQELEALTLMASRKSADLALAQKSNSKASPPKEPRTPIFLVPIELTDLEKVKQYLKKKPGLLMAAARISSLGAQINYANAKSWPILGFEASLEANSMETGTTRSTSTLKLYAQWNLYDGGTIRAESNSLLERKRGLELAYENLYQDSYHKYTTALSSYQTAASSLELFNELKSSYQELVAKKGLQYQGGLISIDELLSTQSRLFEIEQQIVSTEIAIASVVWELLLHLGLLQETELKTIFLKQES